MKGKGTGKKAEEILLRAKSEGVKGLWDREKIIGKEEWAMSDEQKGEWAMGNERWAMGDERWAMGDERWAMSDER